MRSGSDRSYLLRVGFILPLYFSKGASIKRGGPYKAHACTVRRECCSIRGGLFIPRLAPGPSFCFRGPYFCLIPLPTQGPSRSGYSFGTWAGTSMRSRCCCSLNLSSARNIRAHTFWSYFSVGRLPSCSLLRRSRGTPESLLHISDLSWSRARARARVVATVRFHSNRNNRKRTSGCSAQDIQPKWTSAWT